MGFWDAFGQTMKLIGNGVSQLIDISVINIDINQKYKAINQKYYEIGKRISVEEDYSGFMRPTIRTIEKNRDEIGNLNQEKMKIEQQLNSLTTRLNKIETGFFDSSPEVVELKTEIKALKTEFSNIQTAINEKNEMIERYQLELGKEAYSEKYKNNIYGSSYQYIDNLHNEISKLNVEAKKRKDQGKVDRGIIKSNIRYAISSGNKNNLEHFYTKIVGVTYENRQNLIKNIRAGEELFLLQDKDNPYDKSAVAVIDRSGNRLGFLKKELAHRISNNIKNGWKYSVQVSSITGGGTLNYGVNILVTVQSKPKLKINKSIDVYEEDDKFYELDEIDYGSDYISSNESVCDSCSGYPGACAGCKWGDG